MFIWISHFLAVVRTPAKWIQRQHWNYEIIIMTVILHFMKPLVSWVLPGSKELILGIPPIMGRKLFSRVDGALWWPQECLKHTSRGIHTSTHAHDLAVGSVHSLSVTVTSTTGHKMYKNLSFPREIVPWACTTACVCALIHKNRAPNLLSHI